jgi:hypothetical protein
MGKGFAGDPGIYANPSRAQAPTPNAAQMRQAEAKYRLHSYSDGGAGMLRMLRDLFNGNDPNAIDALDPAIVMSLRQGLDLRSAPEPPTAFYPGITHQKLYDSVTDSVDPGQLGGMASVWNQTSEELLDASQSNASNVLASSEMAWEGSAGEAARAAVAQLANTAGQIGQAAQVSAQLYQQQSTALSYAKNSVPEPPAQPFNAVSAAQRLATVTDPVRFMALAQQDHTQFVAQQQAHQQAARIVQQYDEVVTQTSRSQPAYAPAPQVAKPAPHPTAPSNATGSPEQDTGRHESTGISSVPSRSTGGSGLAVRHGSARSTIPGSTRSPSRPVPSQTSTSAYVSPETPPSGSTEGHPSDTTSRGVPQPGGGSNAIGGSNVIGDTGGPGFGGARSGAQRGVAARPGADERPGAGERPGTGARSGAGATAAEETPVERGVAGARGGTSAGEGMLPGARGGKGGEDAEHRRASYLKEPDPNEIFGVDEKTVPPVIG